MSDPPKSEDVLSQIERLLGENQKLLRQNIELLARLSEVVERELSRPGGPPPKSDATGDEDRDREFYMGL